MTTKIPAYGARAAKAPLAPLIIERRKPGPHDISIEILYCGICHSDVHKVNDDWASTHFPIVPGHEIVGRVASRGASVTSFQEGDLVGVGCIVDSCRVCPECRTGHEMFCEKGVTFTFDSLDQNTKTWTYGGYSTSIVVDERYVLRVPKGLDPARAAPLMCAGITTFSPLRQFACKPGDRVAVVGLGGLGHMTVKLAASMGADVTVLSTSRDKEKDAMRLGAKHFVATKEPGALDTLQGRFDLIVDTVSAPHDLNSQLALLHSFGTWFWSDCHLLPRRSMRTRSSTVTSVSRAPTSAGFLRRRRCLTTAGRMESLLTWKSSRPNQINDAYRRMERGDVRYRFVIDGGKPGSLAKWRLYEAVRSLPTKGRLNISPVLSALTLSFKQRVAQGRWVLVSRLSRALGQEWHTHPLGQTLIVTAGCGRVQRWGGPVEEIRPGDVVWISPGEKHWHGATATTAMSHIAIQEQLDGKTADWMEKVSEEQYRA